jgi:hypothetical protein
MLNRYRNRDWIVEADYGHEIDTDSDRIAFPAFHARTGL